MGLRLAEATKACRIRWTRGDRRWRFAAARRGVRAGTLFDFGFADLGLVLEGEACEAGAESED